MRLLRQTFFGFILVISQFIPEILLGEIRKANIYELGIDECLLPVNHPLQHQLRNLFENPKMFKSLGHLNKAGFHTISKRDHKIMVASHPGMHNYLIKKFSVSTPQNAQLHNYLKRISGARALQEFIHLNRLQNIIVPQKWLYPLPDHFCDPNTGERTYLLIVERLDICSGKGRPDGEVARRYSNIDYDTLKELCIVVYYFRGLDSGPCNMPFTYQNKIAFIDTECWDEQVREGFLPRIMPYLGKQHQEYVLEVLKELQ